MKRRSSIGSGARHNQRPWPAFVNVSAAIADPCRDGLSAGLTTRLNDFAMISSLHDRS